MPFIPPFSRSEKVADYVRQCQPVEWREHRIQSLDGTSISLLVGAMKPGASKATARSTMYESEKAQQGMVIIAYFQGNASSLPPRLPHLSQVLRQVDASERSGGGSSLYTVVAVSYRGFWTSGGRPSQQGIDLDAEAALEWICNNFGAPSSGLRLVLWGQSIGAGVVTQAAARSLQQEQLRSQSRGEPRLEGLILETPFTSVRNLLTALYPQRWLPYRYLWPFLRSHWDSEQAIRRIAASKQCIKPKILVLQAGSDELVPRAHGDSLFRACSTNGLDVRKVVVDGALHTDVSTKTAGRRAITDFIRACGAANTGN